MTRLQLERSECALNRSNHLALYAQYSLEAETSCKLIIAIETVAQMTVVSPTYASSAYKQ